MSKQKNPNIGRVDCAHCGDVSAVRRDGGGKYYYMCLNDGMIKPNMPAGQEWILDNAEICIGTDGNGTWPEGTPAWITENWSWSRALREGQNPVNREPAENPEATPTAPTPEPPPPAPVNEPEKKRGFLDFLDD